MQALAGREVEQAASDAHGMIALADERMIQAMDKDYIEARLKAYIARNYWNNEGWYSVLLGIDSQVKKAISLFPEAEKFARLN